MAFMMLVFTNTANEGFIIAIFINADSGKWLRFMTWLIAVQVAYLFGENHFFIKDFQTLLPFYFLIKPFILTFEMPKND
jgi:hypothetical protein